MAGEPIPLLNEYKHALVRRRFLQTLTGGLKIRGGPPWYVHLIQLTLWVAPLLLCAPFIVLEAWEIWNCYYLALVYACVMGLYATLLEVVGVCVRHYHPPAVETAAQALDDEGSINLNSCIERFDFIFGRKKVHSLLLHPVLSGVLSFAGCVLLFPQVMLAVMHPVGVVVVFIVGWCVLCSSLYSLAVSAPLEPATYRPADPLELKYLSRPFYVLAVAACFIATRYASDLT